MAVSGQGQDGQSEEAKKLERALRDAAGKDNLAEVSKLADAALEKVSPDLFRTMIGVLESSPLKAYWTLVNALRNLDGDLLLETAAREIVRLKESPSACDLTVAILGSKSESRFKIVPLLLKDAPDRVKIACLDPIVSKERKELIPQLIDLLEEEEKRDPNLLQPRLIWALRNLTGLDLGSATAWRKWWEKSGKGFECPKPALSETVVGYVKRSRVGQFEDLRKGPKSRIVILQSTGHAEGKHLESVLEAMRIPHTLVTGNDLVGKTYDARTSLAILINCCPDGVGGKKLNEALRRFVEEGGCILGNGGAPAEQSLSQAFPGYVKASGSRIGEEVDVWPARGILADPLLTGVFEDRFPAHWRTVGEGRSLQTLTEKVVVLAEAADAGVKKGTPAPLVAYFKHGQKGGLVVAVPSRFPRDEDVAPSLQNLVLNFLIEAQENFRARGGK